MNFENKTLIMLPLLMGGIEEALKELIFNYCRIQFDFQNQSVFEVFRCM